MRPGQQVFLATKTHTRTAADARRDLEGSLRRLGRERIDLVQVHAVTDDADLDRVLAAGGPVEALVRAREEGLLRFVGVTGHADPAVMARTFERFAFDAILFPLNAVDLHHELAFERTTLPSAVAKGLGRVAMKAFASGNLLERGIDAEPCLRYVYGLDVATVIVGCRTAAEVSLATRVAREAKPLSAEERAALLERTKPHRGRGVEWYKRA
jgi:predicted aldo/keto reductase-like oxidoreductase